MKDLTLTLQNAGYTDITTYIQSGNVVLHSATRSATTLENHISDTIYESHGFKPPVFALRIEELRDAVEVNPYAHAESAPKSLHLFFLDRVPATATLGRLDQLTSATESFTIIGKVLYLHTPDGIARSKFARSVEKVSGTTATARNWRTVSKLLELAT